MSAVRKEFAVAIGFTVIMDELPTWAKKLLDDDQRAVKNPDYELYIYQLSIIRKAFRLWGVKEVQEMRSLGRISSLRHHGDVSRSLRD